MRIVDTSTHGIPTDGRAGLCRLAVSTAVIKAEPVSYAVYPGGLCSHVPKVAPFELDRLTPTVDGLHLQSKPQTYKILNLERDRSETGVPLIELCGDLDRLVELPRAPA